MASNSFLQFSPKLQYALFVNKDMDLSWFNLLEKQRHLGFLRDKHLKMKLCKKCLFISLQFRHKKRIFYPNLKLESVKGSFLFSQII